jgi:very-short-patch-repair endonuclease
MAAGDSEMLHRLASARGGIFLTPDALAAGFSPSMIRYRLETGQWTAIRRGVYADTFGTHAPDLVDLQVAAALTVVGDGAAASHGTAACLLGLDVGRRRSPMIWLTRPPTCRNGRHDLPGIVERAAQLPDSDVVAVRGIRCTSPARTILDLSRHLGFADAVAMTDLALRLKLTDPRELDLLLTNYSSWPGALKARRVLDFASDLAESPLESYSRALFHQHELPQPELQVVIHIDGLIVARLDFLWAASRTIGEADGQMKYDDVNVLWAEKRREDLLRGEGFEFVRWGWDDVFQTPRLLIAKVCAALSRGQR